MIRRCSRALVLTAILTVAASAQCFSECGLSAFESAKSSCHHEEPATPDQTGCAHQHTDFSSPEARATHNVSPLLLVLEPTWRTAAPRPDFAAPEILTSAPPGSTITSSPAVLRI